MGDGPEHRDFRGGGHVEIDAVRVECVDDRVDDVPVLACVLHRRRQRQERLVAVGDGRTRDRARFDDLARAPHEQLGAGADEPLTGVDERTRLAGDQKASDVARVELGVGFHEDLAGEYHLFQVAPRDGVERALDRRPPVVA